VSLLGQNVLVLFEAPHFVTLITSNSVIVGDDSMLFPIGRYRPNPTLGAPPTLIANAGVTIFVVFSGQEVTTDQAFGL
jgi:hypothetical protein